MKSYRNVNRSKINKIYRIIKGYKWREMNIEIVVFKDVATSKNGGRTVRRYTVPPPPVLQRTGDGATNGFVGGYVVTRLAVERICQNNRA